MELADAMLDAAVRKAIEVRLISGEGMPGRPHEFRWAIRSIIQAALDAADAERPPTTGREMIAGMQELLDFLKSGRSIDEWPGTRLVRRPDREPGSEDGPP